MSETTKAISVHILMNQFMRTLPKMEEEKEKEIWDLLNGIVDNAKLKVVEDAEKAISKLRIFSLN